SIKCTRVAVTPALSSAVTRHRASARPLNSGVRRLIVKDLVVRRVWIEGAECTWHTLCEPEAPGLITDDHANGVSRVKEESLLRTQDELNKLLEASRVCPMAAFYLETDTGDILNVDASDWVQNAIASGSYRWVKQ
ncbi:MAG TPA: hypothetical protein VMK82_00295, partial [Steroidobacteraceae bacterium]|nr:hypothetical protein [Steroidobacteraceae bacterium]